MQKVTEKLNKHSKERIEIEEFLTPGQNAEEAFTKMVGSGAHCDGLVISGHHTGSFGGKNSPFPLSIDFIEKLSCDDKNKEFFSNIKSLWLQGCRTLGVGKIEAFDTADQHAFRVGAALEEDHLTQNLATLNMEFSSTLDQDNPLSSRYLRIFPRATTFGWTKTAPGEGARSELSIPFHMAHIAKLNDDRGIYFESPASQQLTYEGMVKYLEVLGGLLQKSLSPKRKDCEYLRDESKFVKAWKDHGNSKNKFSYNNPDLNAYPSLYSSDNEILKRAKELECSLKNASSVFGIEKELDEILSNEALIGLSFNSIYELMLRQQASGDFLSLEIVQKKLKSSQSLQTFLMRKLASNELGTLRKVDYYAFYRNMTGENVASIEQQIQNKWKESVSKPSKPTSPENDFQLTLTASLAQHALLNEGLMWSMIREKSSTAQTTYFGLVAMALSEVPVTDSKKMIETAMTSPKVTTEILLVSSWSLGNSKSVIKDILPLTEKIYGHAKTEGRVLGNLADSISKSEIPVDVANGYLNKIVADKRANGVTLKGVAGAIGNSTHDYPDQEKILNQLIRHKDVNEESLIVTAQAIASKIYIAKPSLAIEMWKEIMASKKCSKTLKDAIVNVIEQREIKEE